MRWTSYVLFSSLWLCVLYYCEIKFKFAKSFQKTYFLNAFSLHRQEQHFSLFASGTHKRRRRRWWSFRKFIAKAHTALNLLYNNFQRYSECGREKLYHRRFSLLIKQTFMTSCAIFLDFGIGAEHFHDDKLDFEWIVWVVWVDKFTNFPPSFSPQLALNSHENMKIAIFEGNKFSFYFNFIIRLCLCLANYLT